MIFAEETPVEICSQEEGFRGSYYSGFIMSRLNRNTYEVQYVTLLSDDGSRPLIEVVSSDEIRPLPPVDTRLNPTYSPLNVVDALDNDGWWAGVVTKRMGNNYAVYFQIYNCELEYPGWRLRLHRDWINGQWITPTPPSRRT